MNQVPWQKGIYVNGNEAELKNAFLMYDRFFHHRHSSPDFDGKPRKEIHILNTTSIPLADVVQFETKHASYKTAPPETFLAWKVDLMAAKPPGHNRPFKVNVIQTETDKEEELTLMICGNTYPFRKSTTTGNYYKNNEVVDRQSGAVWFDQLENIKCHLAVGMLNDNYLTSAMKICILCEQSQALTTFTTEATKSKNQTIS